MFKIRKECIPVMFLLMFSRDRFRFNGRTNLCTHCDNLTYPDIAFRIALKYKPVKDLVHIKWLQEEVMKHSVKSTVFPASKFDAQQPALYFSK